MGILDFIVGLVLLPSVLVDSLTQRPVDFEPVQTSIDGHQFTLYIADTPSKWQHGFKDRDVADNEAMLFVFPEDGLRTFWMKGTKTPLDMVFLDGNMQVIDIIGAAQPCRLICKPYFSRGRYVLELKGGVAEKIGLVQGSGVVISSPSLQIPGLSS